MTMNNDTHDYETRTVKGSDLDNTHVLVGEAGGLSAVYESKPSAAMPGLLSVETEHGFLMLDPDMEFEVVDEGPGACILSEADILAGRDNDCTTHEHEGTN